MKSSLILGLCLLIVIIFRNSMRADDNLLPESFNSDLSESLMQIPDLFHSELLSIDNLLKQYKIRIFAADESKIYKIRTIIPDSSKNYTMQIIKPDASFDTYLLDELPQSELRRNIIPDSLFWEFKDYSPPEKNETEK